MILKSFLVEKEISMLDKHFISLFYGENIGLKDEIKHELKKKYENYEQINFNQDEVISKESPETWMRVREKLIEQVGDIE